MKTWIYRLAAAVLCAALLGAVPASFAENAPVRVGELTWLQEDSAQRSASLAEMEKKISALSGTASGGAEAPEGEDASGDTEASGEIDLYSCEKEIVYFDDLPSMLLALESGDIYAARLYSSVCRYICHRNDNLQIFGGDSFNSSNPQAENRVLVLNMMDAFFSEDFSFLFMQENEELRDLFNGALKEMREDGTYKRLMEGQVAAAIFQPETEPAAAEIRPVEGAETIRVGVTGDLPPIDYFTADGKPAGFSTDILSEISRRTGRNIEFVSVSSGSRMTALNTGRVDVIFWARHHAGHDTTLNPMAWSILLRDHPELVNDLSEEEETMIRQLRQAIDFIRSGENEQMEGTILSDAFYSDWYTYLVRK